MNRFEVLESSPEKLEFVISVCGWLPQDSDKLAWVQESQPGQDPFTVKGHHLRSPYLNIMHLDPVVRDYFCGVAPAGGDMLLRSAISATDAFLKGLLQSERSLDYLQDVIGKTRNDVQLYYRRLLGIHRDLMVSEVQRPVRLTAAGADDVCGSCIGGEHCHMGDTYSESIDALWIGELVKSAPDTIAVLEEKRVWNGRTYPTRAETTMGMFRLSLAELYHAKQHLFDTE